MRPKENNGRLRIWPTLFTSCYKSPPSVTPVVPSGTTLGAASVETGQFGEPFGMPRPDLLPDKAPAPRTFPIARPVHALARIEA